MPDTGHFGIHTIYTHKRRGQRQEMEESSHDTRVLLGTGYGHYGSTSIDESRMAWFVDWVLYSFLLFFSFFLSLVCGAHSILGGVIRIGVWACSLADLTGCFEPPRTKSLIQTSILFHSQGMRILAGQGHSTSGQHSQRSNLDQNHTFHNRNVWRCKFTCSEICFTFEKAYRADLP